MPSPARGDTIRSRACTAPARILPAGATFAATFAASGRRGHGRTGTDRVGESIKRAGQVLSSCVQHDARPRRGRLCRTCAAALDMMQDVALRQRTRTDEATEVSRSRTAITTVGRKRTEVIGLRLTGATRLGCADDVARGSWSGYQVKVSILSRIRVYMALLDMWLAWLMSTTGSGCAMSA